MTGAPTKVDGVQPPEPGPGPGPVPPPPVAGPAPGKGPNRRLRLFLAMGAGILALLCLGGVGVFISLYDEATKINRVDPDAVVDSYLRAYLVKRDDEEAGLFTCRSGADLTSVTTLREELVKREQDFGVQVVVTWSTLTVTGAGDERRSVSTELTIAGTSNGQTQSRRSEPWSFEVVEDDGWRVCGANKTA